MMCENQISVNDLMHASPFTMFKPFVQNQQEK